jgi:hypothetical protein
MNTLRWIIFLPTFFLIQSLSEGLSRSIIDWIINFSFPLDNIFDYAWFFSVWISLISLIISLYGYVIGYSTLICPNVKIGSRVCFWIYFPVSAFGFFMNYKTYSTQFTVFTIIFILITMLILFTQSNHSKEIKPQY